MTTVNKHYGISNRIRLEEFEPNGIAIVKRIKSRIIRKDALKLIELAEKIREIDASKQIKLICNDNICSKSVALLQEAQIEVER